MFGRARPPAVVRLVAAQRRGGSCRRRIIIAVAVVLVVVEVRVVRRKGIDGSDTAQRQFPLVLQMRFVNFEG